MKTPAAFWDRHAKKYAASPIKDMPAYEYTLERTRSYLGPASRVTEIGCGTGSTALLLAGDVRAIRGTDISPQMIKIAQQKAEAQGVGNATFAVADAKAAIKAAAQSDVVLGFNIFHLTENAEALFKELHDTLAPGSVFISKTPCLADPVLGPKRYIFRVMIAAMRLVGYAPFVRRFSFAHLEAAIADAGFEIVETGSFPAMSRFIVARRGA